MKEEVILLNPDKLGYKDRGKMKWLGMILAEQDNPCILNKIITI